MGILKDLFFGNDFNIDDAESVVIIEQTQNYKNKSKTGLLFGDNLFNPGCPSMKELQLWELLV